MKFPVLCKRSRAWHQYVCSQPPWKESTPLSIYPRQQVIWPGPRLATKVSARDKILILFLVIPAAFLLLVILQDGGYIDNNFYMKVLFI